MSDSDLHSREVYVAGKRVYVASLIAQASAAALMIGVLGAVFTWGEGSPLFDLAKDTSSTMTEKPDLGYLVGPALILIALPIIRPRAPHIAYRNRYRGRVALAIVLWLAGLGFLIAKVASLDGYTLQAGTYVAATLLVIGLAATLVMWPAGLPVGRVDRRGTVEVAQSPG